MIGRTKRGQAGLEYLVTYGWAILAIVIIAGVLWYFGIFNPSKFSEERQCGGGAAFQCLDYRVNTSGTLTIVLGNKAGGSVSGVNITSGACGACSCSPASVAANQNTTCTATGFLGSGTAGTSFDQTSAVITYTNTRTGQAHADTLFVKGKYE